MKQKIKIIFFILLSININLFAFVSKTYNQGKILKDVTQQTDVNNAKFIIKNGVPYLDIKNVGIVFNPAGVGVYALQYANKDTYSEKYVTPNKKLFFDLVQVLEKKLTYLSKNNAVWLYNFDNTYNNVHIKAPWYSSFAQAIGIEVFVTAYEKTDDKRYIDLAKKVATSLITPLSKEGLLFEKNGDIWFEEIPLKKNPTHILNAHLRSLIALDKLYKVTNDVKYRSYFDKGLKTLKKWLPDFDLGYWLRYDLNPNYKQLFRITNPYGFKITSLSIDTISILDENKSLIYKEDIGDNDDFNSSKSIYLSGLNWKVESHEDNVSYRRLDTIYPASFKDEVESDKLKAPYTFINTKFPQNDRQDYYLKIDYKDNIKGNLILQQRAISPKIKWKDVDNGTFLLTGDKKQKNLLVKIKQSDLGFTVGLSYAWKHYLYLKKLYEITKDKSIEKWVVSAKSYINLVEYETDKTVKLNKIILPKQTPIIGLWSFDKNKVVRFHIPSDKTTFKNNYYDFKSPGGIPIYSPYVIARQILYESAITNNLSNPYKFKIPLDYLDKYDWITNERLKEVKKEPALLWLKKTFYKYNDAYIWKFITKNSYNDITQHKNWNSSFSQAYVIKAFLENNITDYALKGANAYKYDISNEGVSSFDKSQNIWFEEVPNKTHILNAHLISENVLLDNLKIFNSKDIDVLTKKGLDTLEKSIYKFDTGYWSKYDQNPKKELLFQFDWISGKKSPLIDEICLISTYSHKKSCLDVGSQKDSDGTQRITGIDWLASSVEDKKTVRSFKNGYKERTKIVSGGANHNVFVALSLPDREFLDYWDISPYYLTIKYKDTSKGQFVIKHQSIREGNFLEFMPLYSSNLITTGDNSWKEFIIPIRTNDLGWYMGVDYHKYHIAQMKELFDKTGSIVLEQTVGRWEYYLQQYLSKSSPIVEPKKGLSHEIKKYKLKSNIEFHKGYELKNAIDDNPSKNYVAAKKDEVFPQQVSMIFEKNSFIDKIKLIWESAKNSAKVYTAVLYNGSRLVKEIDINNDDKYDELIFREKGDKIVLTIKEYNGQQRLLMRGVKVYGK